MDTFQPTDTAYRVQDVLTALAFLRARRDLSGVIDLVGLGAGGMWCLLADAIDGGVRTTLVDADRFNNTSDEAWARDYYVPCLRSIGDVSTAAALIAPRRLVVFNTGDPFQTRGIKKAFKAVGADTLDIQRGPKTVPELLASLDS